MTTKLEFRLTITTDRDPDEETEGYDTRDRIADELLRSIPSGLGIVTLRYDGTDHDCDGNPKG